MKFLRHSLYPLRAATLALLAALLGFPVGNEAMASPVGSSADRTRPKICLVLSGGGARGAAHVGVLKVLEEYRIPIDCITGTSMGSIVGGAYATGMSIPDMEAVIAEMSTELLFREQPPRQELSIRRKADDAKNFIGPEMGIRDGRLAVARGLVSGVQLESVLRQLAKVPGFYDFDELPIPFRAVATDLVTGEAVVFSEGELANVMRASMSVPGAVAPAEFEGMMLVDGMLTGNLPVEAALDMGADIIIAVNVGTPLLKREELGSFFGIMGQMLSILTEQNVQNSLALLKPTDILISPDLGDFSTSDFDNLPSIAPLGATAARAMAEQLAPLSLPPDEYAALRARQTVAVVPDTRPVDEIRFVDLQRVNPETARNIIRTRENEPIDQAVLDRDMLRLYGTGDFEHVSYRFMEEHSRRVMGIHAVERSWGPDYVRLGLALSADSSGNSYWNLLGSYRRTWLNSLGAEWRTDAQIGSNIAVLTEFYQPLNARASLFVAPYAGYETRYVSLFSGDTRVALYEVNRAVAGIDLGTGLFDRYGEFRIGLQGGMIDPKLETGPTILSPGDSTERIGAYRARLTLDQLDSADFPRSGWSAGFNVFGSQENLGAESTYTKWDFDATVAYSFGEHTLNLGVRAGDTFGSGTLPRYDLFQWGGFMQQSGYVTGQLIGENIQFGRLVYYRRILRGTLLQGAFGGLSLEVGRVGNPLVQSNPDGVLRSGSLFVAADTPIGPAYLAYGRAKDGNSNVYFFLGRPF